MEIQVLPDEFEWDRYNTEHIRGHKVECGECEQVFFDIPLTIEPDPRHSRHENRYFVLGKTKLERILVVIFTIRNKKIRVITARDANRNERRQYETQKNPKI